MAGCPVRKARKKNSTPSYIDCVDLVYLLCGLIQNWLHVQAVILTSGHFALKRLHA